MLSAIQLKGMTPKEIANHLLADPLRFAKHVLQDKPWSTPEKIFNAIAKPFARVAVKGCHASSKTYTAAECALWFVTRYPDAIVITTAPVEDQVRDLMWGEIKQAINRSRWKYPQPGVMRLDMDPKNRPRNYIEGRTSNKSNQGVAISGYHAPHMLFILDEAPGIPPEILPNIEGAAAGDDIRVLMLGNPTIPSGSFYDAFTSHRTSWECFTIDAYDTPNFDKLRALAIDEKHPEGNPDTITELLRALPEEHPAVAYAPRRYLAGPAWAQKRLREWGSNSPLWQARVRGEFPEQGEDSLIWLAWTEQAKNRKPIDLGGKLQVGIDVAGPGEDETVAIVRSGVSIIDQWSSAAPETEAWNACLAFLKPLKARIDEINIDSAGIGAGFAKQLEEEGFNICRVNVGESTNDPEKYYLLKAQLYWGLRQRFKDGDIAGLTDDVTISQLASIRYKHNARGQVVIESKDDARKRGVKSPDRAEALMLAFAHRTPAIIEYYEQQIGRAQDAQSRGLSEPELVEDDMSAIYEEALRELQNNDK